MKYFLLVLLFAILFTLPLGGLEILSGGRLGYFSSWCRPTIIWILKKTWGKVPAKLRGLLFVIWLILTFLVISPIMLVFNYFVVWLGLVTSTWLKSGSDPRGVTDEMKVKDAMEFLEDLRSDSDPRAVWWGISRQFPQYEGLYEELNALSLTATRRLELKAQGWKAFGDVLTGKVWRIRPLGAPKEKVLEPEESGSQKEGGEE